MCLEISADLRLLHLLPESILEADALRLLRLPCASEVTSQDVTEAEDLEVDESSDRVQLARFFESIAGDAEVYLEALTSGEVPFKVAEADLSKLYGDLERGIEQMHDVE